MERGATRCSRCRRRAASTSRVWERSTPFVGCSSTVGISDTPPLTLARRVLFRLLAEDDDPDYLFEFGAGKGAGRRGHGAPRARHPARGRGGSARAGRLRGRPAAARRRAPHRRTRLELPALAAGAEAVRARRQPARSARRSGAAVDLWFAHARPHAALPERASRRHGAALSSPHAAAAASGGDSAVRQEGRLAAAPRPRRSAGRTATSPTPTSSSP